MKVIAENRKARYDYFIEKTLEAGLVLRGTEVKSIRAGKVNLKDSFASIDSSEIFIEGMHISPYDHGNIFNVDPLRKRKLLLHKKEIVKLKQAIKEKGFTLVPMKLYFVGSIIKLELAVAKGKKLYDKRHVEAEKSAQKDIQRAVKERFNDN